MDRLVFNGVYATFGSRAYSLLAIPADQSSTGREIERTRDVAYC